MLKKIYKWIILIALSLSILSVALFIDFNFPSYQKTVITGMEVKRMDKDGVITKQNPADGPVRDVYFLFTKDTDSGKIKVYRNEDTRFDFPWYFKFDSANQQGIAQQYINSAEPVEIKYYGWRLTYFEEYPNILSINPVTNNSLPLVSYFLYSVLFVLWLSGIIIINRRFK